MIKYLASIILFLITVPETQTHEGILITVEKGHKKITYMAENVTDKDLDIFFKVESSGFRRSADRPQITTIPSKKKVALQSLIPLTGKDTIHSYVAIITNPQNDLSLIKTDSLNTELRKINPRKRNKN